MTDPVTDPVVALAYEHASENLTGQRARLDNLRTRAGTIISAAAVVAAFLGGQALADTRIPTPGGAAVADRSLQLWEVVAFGSFIAIVCLCAAIIRPATRGWTFRLNPNKVLDQWAGKSEEQAKRDLAGYMETYYLDNEKRLGRLFAFAQVALALLAVETIALMLDLTT